jgi:hypothetical protein
MLLYFLTMELLLEPTEFEHDPRPEYIPEDTWQILQMHAAAVRHFELPLLRTLREAYPQRFPRVCGPASIALAHLLSHSLTIPILKADNMVSSVPHLSLLPSWFNPSANPEWGRPDEHTLLADVTGTGYSLVIDPTIRLQHGAPLAPGITRIEWHESCSANDDLKYMANIHRPGSQYNEHIPPFFDDELNARDGHRDMVELMHSPAVFDEVAVTTLGNIHEVGNYWGSRLRGVIEHTVEVCGITP